jgi:hypothetical protein
LDPRSSGALAYKDLTEEVIARADAEMGITEHDAAKPAHHEAER